MIIDNKIKIYKELISKTDNEKLIKIFNKNITELENKLNKKNIDDDKSPILK